MNWEQLWQVAEQSRARAKLSAGDRRWVSEDLPRVFAAFPRLEVPNRVRHPAGFSVTGASVRSLVRSALLLAARGALGPHYHRESAFFAQVETDLALRISLSVFRHGDPPGAYCCPTCTLAVLPLFERRAIHWFDCRPLESNVRALIARRGWRFRAKVDPRMIDWALG
jgi:hypothetical protein